MGLINSLDSARRFERRYAQHLIARFQTITLPGGVRADLSREFVPIRGLQAALSDAYNPPVGAPGRVLLLGGPGAGKTTALAHLALTHARALLAGKPQARVPVFLSARECASNPPRLDDLACILLGDVLAAQCPRGYFPSLAATGRALVLIDDLDALAPAASEPWLDEFGGARVVAASRTAAPGLTDFHLPGFRDTDIQAFAANVLDANAPAFVTALKKGGVPRALTSAPMLLALLARAWRPDQPLPTNRTGLFDAYVQMVMGEAPETARLLEDVALGTLRGQVASNGISAKGRGFIRVGKNRAAEFAHELWQAYWAARALCRAQASAPLDEFLSSPQWRETMLFYAGMVDASEMIQVLVARGELVQAGLAVASANQAPPAARELVERALVGCAWEGDAGAIDALAEMDSQAAVDHFAARLQDPEPAVRARAAEILGKMGLDRAVERLLPQLRDADADVRVQAVAALGLARTDRVIEPLLAILRGDARGGRVDGRLRAGAAQALGQIGSDKAVPALIVDLQGDPTVRAAAALALKHISSPLMIEPLRHLARTGDEEVKRHAHDILAAVETCDFRIAGPVAISAVRGKEE